jgi:hypothetical protein
MVQIRLGHRHVHLGYLDDFDDTRRVYLGAKVLLLIFDQPLTVSFGRRWTDPSTGGLRPSDRSITGPLGLRARRQVAPALQRNWLKLKPGRISGQINSMVGLEDVFDLQDQITDPVVGIVEPSVPKKHGAE